METVNILFVVLGIVLFIFGLLLYFLPTLCAKNKNLSITKIVFWINLLLGYTVFIWFILLIWVFIFKEDERAGVKLENIE